MNNTTHIIPVDDIFEHIENIYCNCKPQKKDGIIIHNSFDRRELFEKDRNLSFYETLEKSEIIFFDFIYRIRTKIRLWMLLNIKLPRRESNP